MALRTLITRLPIRTKSPACPGFLQLSSPWPHSWKFRRSSSIGSRLRTKASSNAIDQARPQHLSLSKLWRGGYIPEVEGAERANESQEEGRSVEEDGPDQWERRGAEIRREILPITRFVKNILHSKRYKDGDKLTPEDEKKVVEKLLPHHPCSQDKIGCGVDAIMLPDDSMCHYLCHLSQPCGPSPTCYDCMFEGGPPDPEGGQAPKI